MGATLSFRRCLRRRRRNPLRRRSDVLQTWVGVAAVALMLLVGPAVGWLTGSLAHGALQRAAHEQQRHRHLVTAVTVRPLPGGALGDHDGSAGRDVYRRALARWAGPDGTEHTAPVSVRQQAVRGERFPLWTDDGGRVAGRPMDPATAHVHAVLAGIAAAAAAAGLVEGARRLVVWRLTQRRYAEWDRAWERAGHTWGRAGAGS
ncbi:hypothetical protein BLA24_08555 [Streptomyces cinnamoneus]|uniref:Uncharacterized protein n=1 Tax=Streptomyces cinnamoneus TaxID=53446 RepID=A0A2G1XM50_STRCJ|nr:hypothetical protein BLA24_08555 [Streptomyces cinnamoneus]PPT12142.1 hypothetical protein CYQ11_03810 [Streptomyces cinnamoneus]